MKYDKKRNCYTLTKLEENCFELYIEKEELQKKLDIATKGLRYYAEGILGSSVAQKALKEMEEI